MTTTTAATWEAVIGLEVHVELATATKLFCACKNEFGAEPNTNICPVCLGLPGSLPVLDEKAVEFALRVGEALNCTVPDHSLFHRKNYFYPDMPKDYQMSQYDEPISVDGSLEVDGFRVGIERAHMEEDTGKTIHVGGGGRIHEADHSLVDYNRAGIPLMEIVSRPDLRTAEQARAYANELRGILQTIGVSDVKMEEGSFRIDANVSLRPAGATELGTKVEVKNMNSIRSLGRALEYEIERQTVLLEAGERVVQETRHWDEDAGVTHSMRTKEGAFDYRYFPEPDLVPVAPDGPMRERVRAGMPELPAAVRARLVSEWGIGEHEARVLIGTPGLDEYAEAAVVALAGWHAEGRRELVLSARCSGTCTRRAWRPAHCRSRPTGSPSSSASSPTARCHGTWPRTCSPSVCASRSGRSRSSRSGDSRRSATRVSWRRSSTRSSPTTPTSSPTTAPATTSPARRSAGS